MFVYILCRVNTIANCYGFKTVTDSTENDKFESVTILYRFQVFTLGDKNVIFCVFVFPVYTTLHRNRKNNNIINPLCLTSIQKVTSVEKLKRKSFFIINNNVVLQAFLLTTMLEQ